MSRDVGARASVTITAEEAAERKTDQGKLIFTKYKGHDCALLLHNDRLKAASFFRAALRHKSSGKASAAIGAVFIGKIKNIAKNIDACFVEIANGEICFLPMKNALAPYLVNRAFDGRLLEGDELLVQIERAAQKTKQATVTAHVSLSNDYFVIMMGTPKVGYSANIDSDTKKRVNFLFTEMAIFHNGCLIQDIKNLLSGPGYSRLTLPSTGCIVRTKAAEVHDSGVLLQQFFDLTAQYTELLHIASHRSCFSCVKEAPSAIENVLEQLVGEQEYQEIVTDNEAVYAELQEIMKQRHKDGSAGALHNEALYHEAQHHNGSLHHMETDTSMKNTKQLRLYRDSLLPLSKLYSIESKMEAALERRVWLKSGGYLIIEHTEALTVIDVNSGKYQTKKGSGETYLKINLEAAEEIALQLRLRNLSGIIIVDFINMKAEDERRALLKHLRDLVNQDNNNAHHNDASHRNNAMHRIKTTIVDMTPLGLVEITRKKVNKPLAEQWADCLYQK